MNKTLYTFFIFMTLAAPVAWADFESDLSATEKTDTQRIMRELHAKAAAGDADAQLNMGGMYFKGGDVEQDYKEAARWFRLAAHQGHPRAQFNLGMMYDTGQGVKQDHKEAAWWYHLAADQGLAIAQLNLGVAYATGQGVTQDESEAVRWIHLAAEQGESQAQFNLGVMYINGQGVPKNLIESYRWAKLAADQGHVTALSLVNDLTRQMTREERRLAEKMAIKSQPIPGSRTIDRQVKPEELTSALPVRPEERTRQASLKSTAETPKVAVQDKESARFDPPVMKKTIPEDRLTAQKADDPAPNSAPARDEIYIQLGAFKTRHEAEIFMAKMHKKLGEIDKAYSIYISDSWVRVHIGTYPTLIEARRSANQLKAQLGFEPMIKRH
ncbi:MAG: SPOR domain-containing protein [Gallionella sp.]|nr:SPOR domain-containing protein [Gallionella sp.]